MARSDAIAKTPTVEEEIAKFKGFSTTDGEVSEGSPTPDELKRANANKDGAVAEAIAAGATSDANAAAADSEKQQAATAAAANAGKTQPVALTDAEEDQAIATAEQAKTDGTPLTDEEADAAVAAALAAKTDKAKHKKDPEKRIAQAVGRQRQAERERDETVGRFSAKIEELTREIATLKQGGLTKEKAATTTVADGAPNPVDFEFGDMDPKYVRALARFEARQEYAEQQAKERKTVAETAEATAKAEFAAKKTALEEAGVKKFGDDFIEDVIESARRGEWALSETVGQLIFDSEVGADVAHYLATNPAEAGRLAKLSPLAAASAFGRLEAKFSSPAADATGDKKLVQATKAPPVPQSRARGAGGRTQVSPDTNDFAAFEAMAMGRRPN